MTEPDRFDGRGGVMEDHAADPGRGAKREPPLTVVVPVRDGGAAFRSCLRALQETDGPDFELIVVDDGSLDGSAALAEAAGATVLRHDRPLGPAAARNRGAQAAAAPFVFFLDADVAIAPDGPAKVLQRFEADPGLAALFGSYDDQPSEPGLLSQFRNLLHHFVHQDGDFQADARPAHTFWTGCGAIRRDLFLELGGFDPRLYRRPAIEDIELGYRLTKAGHRIVLARDLQVTHLKRWGLLELIRTDIFHRGVPWTLLMLRSGIAETDLNVGWTQRASVLSTALIGLGLAVAPVRPIALVTAPIGLAAIIALNSRFYGLLKRRLGLGRALASLPCHVLYFTCCGLSVLIALATWMFPARTRAPIAERGPLSSRTDGPSTAVGPHAPSEPASGRTRRWTKAQAARSSRSSAPTTSAAPPRKPSR